MDAPPLSMSADFFHPTWEGARCHARAARSDAEADRLIRRERIGERIREALRGMHELAMGGGAMDLSGHLMAAEELERQLEERDRGYDGEDEDYRDGDYRGGEGGDVPLWGSTTATATGPTSTTTACRSGAARTAAAAGATAPTAPPCVPSCRPSPAPGGDGGR
ncbi:hypothetical protein THAOC_11732, partial [Thalassiosira oceanica]